MAETLDSQLPYVQVHRSSAAPAADIAAVLGVSHQHARGSLVAFWERLSDRRLLTGKTEIVLDEATTRLRLRLAFGLEVDPSLLVVAGFLETRPDGYRVRGMSRQLATETRRASVASAKSNSERKPNGQYRPQSKALSGPPPQTDSGTHQMDLDTTSSPPRRHLDTTSTPPRRHLDTTSSPQRREVRGESLKAFKATASVSSSCDVDAVKKTIAEDSRSHSTRAKKRASDALEKPSAEFRHASDALVADFKSLTGATYGWQGAKDGAALARILAFENDVFEIRRRWRLGLSAPVSTWASCRTVAQLAAKWNDLAKRDVTVGAVASDDWELIAERHNKEPEPDEAF